MILLKYLLKEALKSQMAVLAVLLTIFVSQQFVRILADAADGQFPGQLVATILALNLPELLTLILPLSLFLGVMTAHGRMYADSEMTVLHAVGVSEWYVTRVTLMLAVLMAGISAYSTLYLAPWAKEVEYQVLEEAKADAGLSSIVQGRFQKTGNGQAVVYVEDIEKGKLSKVFVAQLPKAVEGEVFTTEDASTSIVMADGGSILEEQNGSRRLVLDDGTRINGVINQLEYSQIKFSEYEMEIREQQAEAQRRKMSALTVQQLLDDGSIDAMAELHWRIAIPFSLPLLVLIAVPMSRVNVRQGKYAKMIPAILIFLGYFGLMMAGRKALENGSVPIQMGLWWIHATAFLIGIILVGKGRPSGRKFLSKFRFRKSAEKAA
ncbi:LPS export ABC transporter permease LptF [Ferrimonas lipolytica]|uniref:Lipopolysaccharide export system permease protein LptF n=1 Tax=Ferrimonas lipolytica TaxID=2724191 RepID=A0A6H1UJ94_9GAMM|nr:LPS export ABC transporter permease LptF [Ferrimonas lipolytica]QIZ78699.1 LPS export ABC transporter permease LptF [Ferrimonas lipolytica]